MARPSQTGWPTEAILFLLPVVVAASVAGAQTIVADNFDSYRTDGLPDQAMFLSTWHTDGGCSAGLVSGAQNRQNTLPYSLEERRGGTGTRLVKDIQVGGGSSNPAGITWFGGIGGRIVFAADDGSTGAELWSAINGFYPSVGSVLDINPGAAGSSPTHFIVAGTTVYFTADDGTAGRELWKTNGNPGGTVIVTDVLVGAGSSSPADLTSSGTTLYFTADDGATGRELWVTSGDAATQVKDINLGASGSDPTDLVVSGLVPTLYFTADDGASGREIWRSGGSDVTTILLKDIVVGVGSSSPADLVNVSSILFFTADDGVSGRELWRSQGTEVSTVMVKDIVLEAGGSSPGNLVNASGTLFFTADDGVNGNELWKSDGTEGGTVLVKDIVSGPAGSNLTGLVAAGGRVYFVFDDGVNGAELWVSDGTDAGTMMIEDINPGPTGSAPADLTAIGGALYFSADDGTNGRELWRSNGTPEGTYMVDDINEGPGSSSPAGMSNYNGVVFFAAEDGIHGTELWQTDGNAAPVLFGTSHRRDLVPIIQGMDPAKNAVLGSDENPLVVYFGLDLPDQGTDRYALAGQITRYVEINDGTDAAPLITSQVECGAGSGVFRPRAQLTDEVVHGALAIGAVAVLDQDPCDYDPLAGNYDQVPFVGRVAIYDGLQWHVIKAGMFGATEDAIMARRWNWCTMTVKTNTIEVSWNCKQCREPVVVNPIYTFTVPRQYLGGFRAMELGNGACVPSPFESYLEDVNLAGGVLSDTLDPVGACCLPDSTCLDHVERSECVDTHNGSFRGVGSVCAELSPPCCPIPYADSDADGDVDSTDFAAFQRCVTAGLPIREGCACFDRNGDEAIDVTDLMKFESCQSGPEVPVADPAACDAYP